MALADADIAPPDRGRYTLDGDAAVESRIAADQQRVVAGLGGLLEPPAFRALVLMGGYGRGEGGYVLRDGRPEPYNDYDYFVVVRGMGRSQRNALARALAERAKLLEHEVGVEVDFALLREEALPRAEYSLMNAEMLWGHRVVAGDPQVLRAMPPMPFSTLPPGEFTRLLLNRGSLLLMNARRLAGSGRFSGGEREVLFKYLFKAVLACGDARLAGNRSYHPSYVQKLELLRSLDWPGQAQFIDLYLQAWRNKFHPDYGSFAGEDAGSWQAAVVRLWLDTLSWFEQQRTGEAFADWTAYCTPRLPKSQSGAPWGGLRNAAITLRDFGPGELVRRPRWSLRYPRERLISALPLLLAEPGAVPLRPVADALALPARSTWEDAVATFLSLWRRFA